MRHPEAGGLFRAWKREGREWGSSSTYLSGVDRSAFNPGHDVTLARYVDTVRVGFVDGRLILLGVLGSRQDVNNVLQLSRLGLFLLERLLAIYLSRSVSLSLFLSLGNLWIFL